MKSKNIICDCFAANENLIAEITNKIPIDYEIEKLCSWFKIIGDKTRMKILWTLINSEMCVCDICVLLNMTKSAISHQLKVLKDYNMLKSRKQGKHIYYSLDDNHVKEIINIAYSHQRHIEKDIK